MEMENTAQALVSAMPAAVAAAAVAEVAGGVAAVAARVAMVRLLAETRVQQIARGRADCEWLSGEWPHGMPPCY